MIHFWFVWFSNNNKSKKLQLSKMDWVLHWGFVFCGGRVVVVVLFSSTNDVSEDFEADIVIWIFSDFKSFNQGFMIFSYFLNMSCTVVIFIKVNFMSVLNESLSGTSTVVTINPYSFIILKIGSRLNVWLV